MGQQNLDELVKTLNAVGDDVTLILLTISSAPVNEDDNHLCPGESDGN